MQIITIMIYIAVLLMFLCALAGCYALYLLYRVIIEFLKQGL